MIEDILIRIFVYGYLFIAITFPSIVETPLKLLVCKMTKVSTFVRKLGFITSWAIFTGMSKETWEIEVVAKLQSGKTLRWFLSDEKAIGNIKIFNPTVQKNRMTYFLEYKYFHEIIENKLLDYAYDILKDPMISLKIYYIPYNIDKNKNYCLRTAKRPTPSSPPKVVYEAKWQY